MGVQLNAEFDVAVDGGYLSLVLESAGGRVVGAEHSRNHEYVPALRLLLSRLRDREAVLVSAVVASSRVSALSEDERILIRGRLKLADVVDVERLRREITTAQGRIGQADGATKEGNNRKRIQLRLELPAYGIGDAHRLAQDLATPPDNASTESSPEVTDAIVAAEKSAGRRRGGQGMRLGQADRDEIERHSVALALDHLKANGYAVTDVGATESYDIDAVRPGEHLYVEVKGTTSDGEEVILTKKEVELMTREYPHTMLILVSNIRLDRSGASPVASGGVLQAKCPWRIEMQHLTPISYRYRTN